MSKRNLRFQFGGLRQPNFAKRAKQLHRINAIILVSFIAMHLTNHLSIMKGVAVHIAVQSAFRDFYRLPTIESVLLSLFLIQIGLGIILSLARGRPKEGWAWLQLLSGLYLAFFLMQHLTAVLMARSAGIDTNAYFAAAVVRRAPWVWYFAPYYVFGVAAAFAHLAAALRFRNWPKPATGLQKALPWTGLLIGLFIVGGLMGAFGPIRIPVQNSAYLDAMSNIWFGK